jgi:hypothetical protein
VKWLICLALLFGLGCESMSKKTSGLEPSAEQKAIYRTELDKAWATLAQNESEVAFKMFGDFQKTYPNSIFEAEAKFGEARALEQMDEWALASRIYRTLSTQRLATQPQIAALAMYENSKAAEALGNESEMMASLMDAQNQAQHLPEDIRIAALPARRGMAELKMGDNEAARKSLALADQGLNLLKQRGVPPQTWAQIYYEMGSVSTNQLAPENFQAHLDSFREGQIFLLKAIEAGVSPWSDRALEDLQKHYQDFWNLSMNPPVSRGLDQGAQDRARAELQERWLGQISQLLVTLKQNQRPAASGVSAQEKKLNEFVMTVENETQSRLSNLNPLLPLTPEAQKRQRIKSKGTIRSAPLFPAEQRPSKAKPAVSPSQSPVVNPDPNMKPPESP